MIIGHRGAAGLALENTMTAFNKARDLGISNVELDVRKSKDGQLVVLHDKSTGRVSNQNLKVANSTYQELSKIILKDGKSRIPLLNDVITNYPGHIYVELKDRDCVNQLVKILNNSELNRLTFISSKYHELIRLKQALPKANVMLIGALRPLKTIKLARAQKFRGVSLGFWLLNPVVYSRLKHQNLSAYVWTVNSKVTAKIINTIYPDVSICTNRPDKLQFLEGTSKS